MSDEAINSERVEVSLGAECGTKVFQTLEEADEWLVRERQFWQTLFQTAVRPGGENSQILQKFNTALSRIGNPLVQAKDQRKRAADSANKQVFDATSYRNEIKNLFAQYYDKEGVIAADSPRGRFIAELAAKDGDVVALFAAGYMMRHPTTYDSPIKLRGALAGSYYEQGFVNPISSEQQSLDEMRTGWEKKFQVYRDDLIKETEAHRKLNADAAALIASQTKTFAEMIAKEQKDWAALHKTYDETLALAKPVRYWKNKADRHLSLTYWFGAASVAVGVVVFILLFELIQKTLKMPDGIADPTKWQPEHWRIGVLLAAGVFSVWVVRILVQLFLSNVHLLTDARERVTMAQTYFALMRKQGMVKDEDRQLVLHALFRPAATGVVKDDGIPLSILELLTKAKGG